MYEVHVDLGCELTFCTHVQVDNLFMKSAEVTSDTQKILDLGPEHLSQLRALESLCFEYHWTEEQFRLGLEKKAFFVLGYEEQGILIGYLAYSIVLDEMEILNLGVHPDFRRKGIGRALMQGLMLRCREMDVKRGLLDVKESNAPAIGLYESLGFVQVGVRKNYYPDTREDALLYDLNF